MSRLHVWTLYEPLARGQEPVKAIEWDREKVEAAIAAAIRSLDRASPEQGARAIFDALDPEGP